ncbi:MAG: asparaginase [Hyphomicrobium sp.]
MAHPIADSFTRNPVLIEVTRGPLVECRHRGTVAVCDAAGDLVLELGNVRAPVYPRSAIKPLQALPFIESGAADRYGFGNRHIALAAASHSGTREQVATAGEMLAALGLDESIMHCGSHLPRDQDEQRALLRTNSNPTQLHHNCSGKHAAMLATACHLGEPTATYERAEHPVQQRIRALLEDMSGAEITDDFCGIDGCSVPNWALPAANLARAYARFGTGKDLSPERAKAARRIMEAAQAEPDFLAGPGRLDTRVQKLFGGAAFVKTGAEGAYAGCFPQSGLGFALKMDDGASRGAEAVVSMLIEAFLPQARGKLPLKTLKNAQGKDVGVIRPSPLAAVALR